MHGLDGDRAKWGRGARAVLGSATWMSARLPHATVTVSQALAQYYRETYAREAVYITNGVKTPTRRPPGEYLDRLGVRPGGYVLSVGRLVPEKAPHLLVEAFRGVPGDVRLVLVGGSSHSDDYVEQVRELAARDPRVVMPGFVHGADLEEVYTNAALFAIPSLLEGLPLTLLEAASFRLPVLASAIAPHVEVLGTDRPGARLVPPGDVDALRAGLVQALSAGEPEQRGAADLHEHVLAHYSWDHATDELEALYRRLVAREPAVR